MTTATTTPARYAPSALNRLFSAVERLPGGGWWIYPLSFLALIVYHHAALWIIGSVPVGSPSLAGVPALAFGPYALGVSHLFIRIAGRSMEAFRPASGLSDADYSGRRFELLTVPPGRLWLPFLVGAIVAVGSILSASPSAIAAYGVTRGSALLVFGPAALFGYGMAGVSVYFSARILQQVDRLHREATAIDLFDTAPIYAFSALTVRLGIAYVLGGYYALFVNSAFQAGNILSLASIAITVALGVACFVVPLWGIHGRLAAAKAVLVRGSSLRDQALEAELFRRVDAGNLAGVKEVADALSGIRATSDRIAKLPTWPWPPQVLRGFISAILLPVAVFLITRYVGSQIN